MKSKIIVLGKNGQLASCLRALRDDSSIHFVGSDRLNFLDSEKLDDQLQSLKADWIINTMAYTAVDKAESEIEQATAINALAPTHLAKHCKAQNISLIHISTDFVFDGTARHPYIESDTTNPINIYGRTKREGEQALLLENPNAYIFRTSWLYSEFGNNFVKTILRLLRERDRLGIVWDQIGSPTDAMTLAQELLHVIDSGAKPESTSLFHYSNQGVASWYDFAKTIARTAKIDKPVEPILSRDYKTAAQRPSYSVLDKEKFKSHFGRPVPHWIEALENSLQRMSL